MHEAAYWARSYADVSRRAVHRYGLRPQRLLRRVDRAPVFVIGSPRSGTTYLGSTLGTLAGFADLGEVTPLKAAMPRMFVQPADEAAATVRRILGTVQRLSLLGGLRVIEQSPEVALILPAVAHAFPRARFVHMLRDPRDVAVSLVERGWLRARAPDDARPAVDDARQPFGAEARFWVEDERRDEFPRVSELQRAAWVWRRFNGCAVTCRERDPSLRLLAVRYEELATAPAEVAAALAAFLDLPGRAAELAAALAGVHDRSVGRWRTALTAEQVAVVEQEASPLMQRLGYPTAT